MSCPMSKRLSSFDDSPSAKRTLPKNRAPSDSTYPNNLDLTVTTYAHFLHLNMHKSEIVAEKLRMFLISFNSSLAPRHTTNLSLARAPTQ